MILIEGAIRVIPHAVSYDAAQLRAEDDSQPAVVQSLQTANGVIQVIYPADSIDQIIEGLTAMKEAAEKGPSDLYVPESAEQGLKQAQQLHETTEKLKVVEKGN